MANSAQQQAAIDISTATTHEIVAGISGKKIRVMSVFLVCAGAVEVTFEVNGADGPMSFAANGGLVLPHSPGGWFETGSGDALEISLGGAVAVGGSITYVEVE